MYLQLQENYRNFDKLRIKEIFFYDGRTETDPPKIAFKYEVYRNVGSSSEILFEKHVAIQEKTIVENIAKSTLQGNLTLWNFTTKNLLQYLIDKGIENGTLELE